jgi:hypothetical protein
MLKSGASRLFAVGPKRRWTTPYRHFAPAAYEATPLEFQTGMPSLPWKPGHLRSAYGAICCHRFKPKNQTDDIFLAQILGHKLLGPNASASIGSYKDFYIQP